MEKLKALVRKHREVLAYLFFGGVTTLVNIVAYNGLAALGLSTGVANAIAWVLSVLVAYFTNRKWVFQSRSAGAAAAKPVSARRTRPSSFPRRKNTPAAPSDVPRKGIMTP